MEIKSKKYINEGFNSKAYIINDEYILLEGVNKNSYDNYKKYSESLNKLVDVKSLQIPNIIELIAPNNEFPNGAMVYKMIKGHTFTKSYIGKVDKEQLAKKLADFMNELYEVPVIFDKKIYVEQELNNAKINLELLREYLDDEKYSLLLNWYNEYIEYLSEFDNYHFIHGDLWYENYILDDNDELTGIIDFENAKYGDPASDISALCYLGNEFINLFLKYYKNSDKDIEKRINMFIKAREVMSFENMVNNFPEEINEQIEKIKKVL